jgi:hypothetical protein
MAMTPAICDSCGAIFGSEGFISGTGATNITITGSKVGPCPNCGGMGSIPDGVYGLQDDTLKVIQASGTSPDTLQSLIGLLESLERGEASGTQVIDRIEREAPALAPTVRSALGKSDPAKWIPLLIAIITLYLQATTASPPSADEVGDAIREKPVPTYSVPLPAASAKSPTSPPKGKAKKKRPPKAHGKGKQRKSRKRR